MVIVIVIVIVIIIVILSQSVGGSKIWQEFISVIAANHRVDN